jgi:hypothetical protein
LEQSVTPVTDEEYDPSVPEPKKKKKKNRPPPHIQASADTTSSEVPSVEVKVSGQILAELSVFIPAEIPELSPVEHSADVLAVAPEQCPTAPQRPKLNTAGWRQRIVEKLYHQNDQK